MSLVFFINGLVLATLAVFMGLSAVVFSATSSLFAQAAILTGFIGAMICIATSSYRPIFSRPHLFLLTSSVWMTAAIAGAVPLYLWALSPTDAFFEAMSGITTTGSIVITGLDTVPHGIIMWRAVLHALGGVGFMVTGMALLPVLKIGGMQLFRTESSDKGEKELRSAAMFASATVRIYVGLIALCALVYYFGGMSVFDAITHAMSTLSTGGFSGYDASFGHFQSPFLQWSATLFMLLGAVPFAWYIRGVYRLSFRSEQVEAMMATLAIVISGLTVWLIVTNHTPPLTALRLVAFNVVSVVTTTGFATTDYMLWGPFAVAVFFFLTAVGGCTGSTAGGAKAMRWLLFGRAIKAQLRAIRYPHQILTIRYEGKPVQKDVMNGVIAFFTFYFATFAGLSVILSLLGLDFVTAISGALTALANVGPGVGPLIGPAGNFAALGASAKIVLAFGMFVGRLEMLTVFVLVAPVLWREDLLSSNCRQSGPKRNLPRH